MKSEVSTDGTHAVLATLARVFCDAGKSRQVKTTKGAARSKATTAPALHIWHQVAIPVAWAASSPE